MPEDDHRQTSDEVLIVRVAEGDVSAFEVLVTRWQDRIVAYAWRMLGDRHAAEDVTQQTFANILRRAGDFGHRAKFATYLYRAAHNLCLNERRRRMRHPAASLETARARDGDRDMPLTAALPAHTPDPANEAGDAERNERIRRAVAEMPAMYRQVVILRVFEQMPFARISQIAATNENTIKSRFRYALEHLAGVLEEKP